MKGTGLLLEGVETKIDPWLLLLILVLGSMLSALIPPFQSPDEFDHIQRAYLLTRGQILLHSPQGRASGGEIDTGLLSYFSEYKNLPFHPQKTLSQEEEHDASSINWSGRRIFRSAAGTGYYFPLAYLPQSIGLGLGESLGLSVGNSYQLARFFVLAFSITALVVAFSIFPVNAFILGLLILPMSVFQFLSASLDAFTTALTCLSVSLFMRGYIGKLDFPMWMSYLLAICIVILSTSRLHLLPFLVLPLLIWFVRRERALYWQFIGLTIFALVWTLVAAKYTYDGRVDAGHSTYHAIIFYIKQPTLVMNAIINTVSDPAKAEFYRNSFIGMLGWLDTKFDDYFYVMTLDALVILGILSVSFRYLKVDWHSRVILVGLSLTSCSLIFLSLLLTWNAGSLPAKIIEGIQGRYFIGPLIILGYALSGLSSLFEGPWKRMAVGPLLLFIAIVSIYFPIVLLERYYMTENESNVSEYKVEAGSQLSAGSPIAIMMTSIRRDDRTDLKRIGVRIGTYIRQNSGDAELRLTGPDGALFVQRFALPGLVDNKYRYFDLSPGHYTSGEIVSLTGGGVSAWESHDEKGGVATCIDYQYVSGKRRFTPGCPHS